MKEVLNNIQIIFTENDTGVALDLLSFLKKKAGNTHVATDSAVIIISDEATADQEWQKEVRSLNPAVRLIPAGAIINADYSNPEVIPKKIEELNFIRIDEDFHDNVWESLTIDADFYDIRNTVLVSMNAWTVSDRSDSFLMADYGQVRRCLRKVREKISSEKDAGFLQQLQEMKEYLEISRKYAKKIFMRTLRQRVSIGILAVLFGVMVYFGVVIIRNLQRAARETALLGQDFSQARAAENFVMLCDGVANPYIDGNVRGALYNEMVSYLDKEWPTTPTGLNYKYRLYDPHLLDQNDRYMMVTASNRSTLLFDTYTGKIEDVVSEANDDLKAYFVDQINQCIILVDSENRILFGDPESHQYLTNNVNYPFTGNTDIRIRNVEGYAIIYDDKNEFLFQVGGTYRPVSYVTPQTMGTENYTIHDIRMYESESVVAMEVEGIMNYYYSPYDEKPPGGWSMEIAPKADCAASVYRNIMAFADENGNVIIFDREKLEAYTIGLKLPDVKYLVLLSDNVLAYHDARQGTHLYHIKEQADLGEIFSGFENIEYLGAGRYTVFCYADGAYHCQDVANMTPKMEIDESTVLKRYTGTDPADEGYLYNVHYGEDHLIHYDMDVYESNDKVRRSFYLDGAGMTLAGEAVSDQVTSIRKDEQHFSNEPVSYTGEVTVIGLIDDGFGMVIGTSDGNFREFTFDYDGSWRSDAEMRIPTHAAVTEIIECEDCYRIKDAGGYYWYCSRRWPVHHTENSGMMIEMMNEKIRMHGYFPQDVLDSISEQTVKDMGLQVLPGSDGKEWE